MDPPPLCLLHVTEGNFGQALRSTSQSHRDFAIISQQNFGIRSEWGGTQWLFTDAEELWFLLQPRVHTLLYSPTPCRHIGLGPRDPSSSVWVALHPRVAYWCGHDALQTSSCFWISHGQHRPSCLCSTLWAVADLTQCSQWMGHSKAAPRYQLTKLVLNPSLLNLCAEEFMNLMAARKEFSGK